MNSHNPFSPGSLVAAYFRDSGGEKQELSIPRQEAEFRRWCAENGLIPGRIFQDEARPGSSVISREQFQEMMHYFRSGSIPEAGLVIWNYQRFAREIDDSQFFRADIRRRGYIFYSLNDDVPEGPLGRVYEALLDWKNEQFLADLSNDVRSGLRMLVEKYGAVPGTPPRGFRREPITISSHRDGKARLVHRWVPDPDLIPQVRLAFNMLLRGSSLFEIHQATQLYGSINSWSTFFRNPIYKGVLEYADLTIENYCEPMVDAETWAAAQAIIARRAHRKHLSGDNPQHPRRVRSQYLLSGLLYCVRCGSPMSGSSTQAARVNGEPYYIQRYACSQRMRRRDCDASFLPAIFVDDLVINSLVEELLTPESLIVQQSIALEGEGERRREIATRQAELRQRLGVIRRKISNVTESLAEEGRSRSLLAKLSDLEADESDLLSRISLLEVQANSPFEPLTEERLRDQADRLREMLTGTDFEKRRQALRGMIRRISVEREGEIVRMYIEYYYPPEEHPPPGDIMSLKLTASGSPGSPRLPRASSYFNAPAYRTQPGTSNHSVCAIFRSTLDLE